MVIFFVCVVRVGPEGSFIQVFGFESNCLFFVVTEFVGVVYVEVELVVVVLIICGFIVVVFIDVEDV